MNKAYLYLALSLFLIGPHLHAEETNAEKVQNRLDETGTKMNKTGRKIKKEVRDATGNHSTKEDIKDGLKNAGDEIEDAAKKTKRKID